jgi:hypothetical protein
MGSVISDPLPASVLTKPAMNPTIGTAARSRISELMGAGPSGRRGTRIEVCEPEMPQARIKHVDRSGA